MKFDSVKFVQEHPVDVAMVEILDESAVERIAKEQGKYTGRKPRPYLPAFWPARYASTMWNR